MGGVKLVIIILETNSMYFSNISVQNNLKKNRLELFGVFSDYETTPVSGEIWNISENKNG